VRYMQTQGCCGNRLSESERQREKEKEKARAMS
jgi:hypothetical protein